MPSQLHIVKARDFIRLNSNGTLDFENSRKMLTQIAQAQLQGGIDRAVLDLRGSEGKLTITDIYKLAMVFRDAGPHRDDRLALVVRHHKLDRADFFASLAASQGIFVAAFDSYEEAIDWLFSSEVYNPSLASTADPDQRAALKLN